MSNEERPKRSWREIDKARDGSSGSNSGRPASERGGPHEERSQKQYRAALEALFERGEIGKLADKLVERNGGMPRGLNLDDLSASGGGAPGGGGSGGSGAASGDSATGTPPTAVTATGTTAAAADAPAEGAPAPAPAPMKKRAEDKTVLRRKVVEAAGRHEISKAVEKYLERFPLPDDHEFLEQMLEHEHESRITESMDRIAQMLDKRMAPKRSRALCSKLRYLQETSSNEELVGKADALLKRLG